MNLERLNGVDRLFAMSSRLAEIYVELGIDKRQIETMQLTLAHISKLTPRRCEPESPLTFATLGGGESPAKGSQVLLDAVQRLERDGHRDFRLLVFGKKSPHFLEGAKHHGSIELVGAYDPSDLDGLLEQVDVGLMPSTWEGPTATPAWSSSPREYR